MKIAEQNIGSLRKEAKKSTKTAEVQSPARPKAPLQIASDGQLLACSESKRIRWTCAIDPDGLWAELSRFGNDSRTLHCEGGPEQPTRPMRVQVQNDAGECMTFLAVVRGNWTVVADPRAVPVAVNALMHAGLKQEISGTVSKAFLDVAPPGDVE